MKQLEMYWRAVPTDRPTPPPGFTVRCYNQSEADAQAWMEICREGLLQPQDTREIFDSCVVQRADFAPQALFFVEQAGRPVATVTALLDAAGAGIVHMVGALPCCRGQGLGGLLCRTAQASLWQRGCTHATLSTDDFRVPAVKSYLRAGFVPINCGGDMEQRWQKLLCAWGYTDVPFVDKNGREVGRLNRRLPAAEKDV